MMVKNIKKYNANTRFRWSVQPWSTQSAGSKADRSRDPPHVLKSSSTTLNGLKEGKRDADLKFACFCRC